MEIKIEIMFADVKRYEQRMQRRLLLCIYVSSILAVSIPSADPLDELYHKDDTLNGSQLDKIRALGGNEELEKFSWPAWMAQSIINQRQPSEAIPHDMIPSNQGDIISVDADDDLTDKHARGLSLMCGDRIPSGLKISPEIVSMISQAKKISHTKPDKAEVNYHHHLDRNDEWTNRTSSRGPWPSNRSIQTF